MSIGIDIGRVLIAGDGPDTSFLGHDEEAAMRAPEMPGALAAVARLVNVFDGAVWLVSKCGPRIEARTRRWLEARDFYAQTGMPADHLHFCRKRPEKAVIATRLELERFVDDRADVLRAMRGLVPTLVLFGATSAETGMIPARDWKTALPIVLR